ncbi:hypothetical protein [Amycolatopsis sp.]|uniref:hypothetical protein n=1 Tax=Amycolatopsis sp. TaxID=37632 RepID=UPI002D1E0AB7|nr:hypothetical protein [Amycolatopsis sp.]HVV08327.1 hypothetical protein [Amycolatopsis sp.]
MVVFQLALGIALALIGWWGRRNAPALARAGPGHQHRTTVLRRGALACQVVALLFVLTAVPSLI